MKITQVVKSELNNFITKKETDLKVTRKTSVKKYKKQTKDHEDNKGTKFDISI